ncbi:MAG: hypothetical protein L3K02_07875 [Thermoplasmata archaeon]|nr:hypothetical protein [Thermoplasmata archaeon]
MTNLFPSDAPAIQDLLAIVEVALAIMLVGGWALVRLGHIRVHKYLQSSIVLVNIPIVLYGMVPYYLQNIVPALGSQWQQGYVLVPTLMLIAGVTAEVLGIYIILVAGTSWVPERFRFRRYKLWMRTELGLWWAVVLAGLTTYWLFYVPGASL